MSNVGRQSYYLTKVAPDRYVVGNKALNSTINDRESTTQRQKFGDFVDRYEGEMMRAKTLTILYARDKTWKKD